MPSTVISIGNIIIIIGVVVVIVILILIINQVALPWKVVPLLVLTTGILLL